MKSIYTYFFGLMLLFVTFPAFGDAGKDIKVEKIATNDKFFKGTIDEKYAISIYLHAEVMSSEHGGIYSVSGYYYYDKIKKQIPLVGIYNGDLTLYAFNNPKQADSIVHFVSKKTGFYDAIDDLCDRKGYTEKFTYAGFSVEPGEWFSGNKKLKFQLSDNDLAIKASTEYLIISDDEGVNYINLSALGNYDANFTLEGTNQEKNDETRILISFEYPTNLFVNGRCGAGLEAGFLSLTLNEFYYITDMTRQCYESCANDFYAITATPNGAGITSYTIGTSSDEIIRLEVNYRACSLVTGK